MAQIFIYSGPIHSGKTTRLEAWIDKIQSVDGILTPIINNKRYIKYISTDELHLLESEPGVLENFQQIGKYKFRTEIFQQAHDYILGLIDQLPKWIVIDEIGFLELGGQGFEPAVTNLIHKLKTRPDVNLIIVIRDYLREKVLDFYQLELITLKEFKPE
jgi:nucleoside-triphosphatase THEP1